MVSWLISKQTRGEFSHASILLDDGRVIEALSGKGVVSRRFTEHYCPEDVLFLRVPGAIIHKIEAFLHRQVGKGYDYTMVARFISRRQECRKSTGKWFCSELVTAALREGGLEVFLVAQPWEVSPSALQWSVQLPPDEVVPKVVVP